MNINWKQKLTSRKFWAAIIGFITAMLVAFGVNDLTIEQVVALIIAASTLIAYIIGEGMVDVARLKTDGKDEKLDIFFATDKLTKAEYDELTALLHPTTPEE